MRDISDNRLIYRGRNLKNQIIRGYPDKIGFSGIVTGSQRIQIAPLKGGHVYINNRVLRGKVSLIRKDNRRILAVNELGLEDYVRGILCHEVAPWWPMDALKAQAVVARSYALYQKQFTKNKDFDLTNDIYSQVYGGKASERWRTNRAVDLTRGEALNFQDNLFPAYYHATCGGYTEDAKNLWKIDIIPLRGVACNFCAHSPHFNWKAGMALRDISAKLTGKGFPADDISGIEIISRNGSGRINQLEIRCPDKSLVISAKDFRQALGPNTVRSANFSLKVISGMAYFEGLGWGHGVGMCQWGSYYMAKSGENYRQILQHYYPQSNIVTLK